MRAWLEIAMLQLLVWWRQALMAAGRVIWFAIAFGIGKALFDSEIAAAVLGGVVAVMTFHVGVTAGEVDESASRVTGRSG